MNGRRLLDLAMLSLAVAVGCSALVDPRPREPRCDEVDGGARVCPEGLSCMDGVCKPTCGLEQCANGIDDDCDGNIDEVDPLGRDTCGDGIDNDCDGERDEGSDFDMDGWNWCGDTMAGGRVDCDDSVATVNPGLPESCDGQDNDCDGKVDEDNAGRALCPAGSLCASRCVPLSCANEGPRIECGPDERCDVNTGLCTPRSCGGDACAPNELCDPVTNTCIPREELPNGSACAFNEDCDSGSCIEAAALRLAMPGRVCGQACCDDRSCPEGQRCFASGSGARSCLPADMVPMSTPLECTSNDACPAFRVCGLDRGQSFGPPTFVQRNNVITSNCVLSAPTSGVGDMCTPATFAQCQTRVCVPGRLFGNVCSNPCGTSNDCRELGQETGGAYCRYVDVSLGASAKDYAAVCVVRRESEVGEGRYGEECSTGADCLEGGCVEATATTKGKCTTTCCNDSQCGPREDGVQIRCRPFAFGDRYEMRCGI
ncbi:MAG: putative metal-binding motif-containing protein [Polyangiales bacterium]